MILKRVFMRFKTLIIVLSTITLLLACSQSKRALWHYNKAVKNGLSVDTDTIKVATIDSVAVAYNDTIIFEKILRYKDTVIKILELPKTRWQTRIEYRYKTQLVKQDVLKYKYIYKDKKQEKAKTNWRLFFWGLLVGFILNFALRILDKLYNPFNK
jgi:hypothetical protein